MSDDKKIEMHPTSHLRWFHPAGQIQTGRELQQLWTDGDAEEWRAVEVVNED